MGPIVQRLHELHFLFDAVPGSLKVGVPCLIWLVWCSFEIAIPVRMLVCVALMCLGLRIKEYKFVRRIVKQAFVQEICS